MLFLIFLDMWLIAFEEMSEYSTKSLCHESFLVPFWGSEAEEFGNLWSGEPKKEQLPLCLDHLSMPPHSIWDVDAMGTSPIANHRHPSPQWEPPSYSWGLHGQPGAYWSDAVNIHVSINVSVSCILCIVYCIGRNWLKQQNLNQLLQNFENSFYARLRLFLEKLV